jgi:hypothetical protein
MQRWQRWNLNIDYTCVLGVATATRELRLTAWYLPEKPSLQGEANADFYTLYKPVTYRISWTVGIANWISLLILARSINCTQIPFASTSGRREFPASHHCPQHPKHQTNTRETPNRPTWQTPKKLFYPTWKNSTPPNPTHPQPTTNPSRKPTAGHHSHAHHPSTSQP